jgi:hypothetical protein
MDCKINNYRIAIKEKESKLSNVATNYLHHMEQRITTGVVMIKDATRDGIVTLMEATKDAVENGTIHLREYIANTKNLIFNTV